MTASKRDVIPGRFWVQLKGRQYFVLDTQSGMTMGGPFRTRAEAQAKSDALEKNMGVTR